MMSIRPIWPAEFLSVYWCASGWVFHRHTLSNASLWLIRAWHNVTKLQLRERWNDLLSSMGLVLYKMQKDGSESQPGWDLNSNSRELEQIVQCILSNILNNYTVYWVWYLMCIGKDLSWYRQRGCRLYKYWVHQLDRIWKLRKPWDGVFMADLRMLDFMREMTKERNL